MKLDGASVRVSVETKEQLEAVIGTPGIDLIYLDAGFFAAEDFGDLVKKIQKGCGGIRKLAGLRLPKVFRTEAEAFFRERKEEIRNAGFDAFLVPSLEGALWLTEEGFTESGENIILDHSVYTMNAVTDGEIRRLTGFSEIHGTYSLEMSFPEIRDLGKAEDAVRELVIYGRVPMMISAQCIRRTALRCDKRMCTMSLRDRTGAFLPVKNNCPFCYNTIYNAVPTVIFDEKDEIEKINPSAVRYEFTVEKEKEVKNILSGIMPKNFTRGHFHKGVM